MTKAIEELQHTFNKLAKNAAIHGRKDIVSNTALRVVNRETDTIFNFIGQFYSRQEAAVNSRKGSKTKVLLIKPVGDHCNLRCTYCYETLRLKESHEKVMSIEQIKKYLRTFVGTNSGVTDIFLHGGEPLLAGKAFFNVFIDVLREMKLYGKITLGVQTNATLLDDEWVEFLKKHNFRIGVSLDGDKNINDSFRIDHNGRGSYERVVKGMRLLQKHDVPFGVICVVSAETAFQGGSAKRILDHFVSLGVKYVDIHPALTPNETSGTAAKDNMSRDLYTHFMTELMEAWVQCENPDLRLRCVEDIFENLSSVKSSTCYSAGLCTNILGIDPSGNVSPCTRPFHEKYIFGNAGKNSLQELESSDAFNKFVIDEKKGRDITRNCQWSVLCGYGNCPHERLIDGKQDPAGRHIFCSCSETENANNGYPGFYKNLLRILKEYLECKYSNVAVLS